ncbi:MAG: hypothetical protein M3313_04225 [Actinomycetota bacterium]|nr:hypothetical protein [Actinomycetota bacterium]
MTPADQITLPMPTIRTRIIGPLASAVAVVLVAGPARSDPVPEYGPAQRQCTINDPEIDELSGLAALATGEILLVEDSVPEPGPGSTSILMYRLDALCAVQGDVEEFDQDPRDIEDLAFRDGTVWFADIGDNGLSRSTIALITVTYDPGQSETDEPAPVVYRLAYPDGPRDAEALLLSSDGTPYVVTKDPTGRSEVYRPTGALDASAEVAMEKVAELEFPMTGTPGGPIGRAGQVLVTGGAVAADGSHIALRTYTDAYVWAMSGSDVAAALQADPVAVVALPDAPQGEAISFAADSRSLLLGSEGVGSVITVVPATRPSGEPTTDAAGATQSEAPSTALASSTPGGTVFAGLLAVVVATGLIWIVLRVRRRGS